MRILEQFEVTLKSNERSKQNRTFTIVQDDGERFDVDIPDIPKIVEAFEWMSDNDCLRHLRKLEPVITDNQGAIDHAQSHNNLLAEHSYMLKNVYPSPSTPNTFYRPSYTSNPNSYSLGVSSMVVPDYEGSWTWVFYSKEHAVMFKLAMG